MTGLGLNVAAAFAQPDNNSRYHVHMRSSTRFHVSYCFVGLLLLTLATLPLRAQPPSLALALYELPDVVFERGDARVRNLPAGDRARLVAALERWLGTEVE